MHLYDENPITLQTVHSTIAGQLEELREQGLVGRNQGLRVRDRQYGRLSYLMRTRMFRTTFGKSIPPSISDFSTLVYRMGTSNFTHHQLVQS